jgi:hypothetical protein
LSQLCPVTLDPRRVVDLTPRLLVVVGDRGIRGERVAKAAATIPGASLVTLRDYEALMWSDLATDRGAEIGSTLLDFLRRVDGDRPAAAARLPEGEGEIAGISYHIRGLVPPLLLLAPSQWDPLAPALSEHYCTIAWAAPFSAASRCWKRAAEGFTLV